MMKYTKFLFSKGLLPVSCSTPPVSNKLHQQTTVLGDHTVTLELMSKKKTKQQEADCISFTVLPCTQPCALGRH